MWKLTKSLFSYMNICLDYLYNRLRAPCALQLVLLSLIMMTKGKLMVIRGISHGWPSSRYSSKSDSSQKKIHNFERGTSKFFIFVYFIGKMYGLRFQVV
jgi:hypothetical protein